MNKLPLIFMSIFLISFLSAASSFDITLKPHYYINSQEILVYNNETEFDGISFDVIGKNMDITSRIINLSVIKTSPDWEFNFPNSTETLISNQQKILWKSEIIDTSKFNQSEPFFVIVGVEGINEVLSTEFYTEGQKEIILNNPQNSVEDNYDLIKNIGNFIWEGNYQAGLLTGVVIIVIIWFIFWRYRIGNKMERMRVREY